MIIKIYIHQISQSRKKGLTLDEKKTRMVELLNEKKDFYQLKELEKLCQKEKGITSMSVKDVLTELVSDGLVESDKIGTCVYFWALSSKSSADILSKIGKIESEIANLKLKLTEVREKIAEEKDGKEESSERLELFEKLNACTQKLTNLNEELRQFEDCDPDLLSAKKRDVKISTDAVNRWTDNVFSLQSWMNKKFNVDTNIINKQFSIPEDIDYI